MRSTGTISRQQLNSCAEFERTMSGRNRAASLPAPSKARACPTWRKSPGGISAILILPTLKPPLPRSRPRGSDMANPLSSDSWQYRGLNAANPGLDHLSNGIIDLVKAGRNVVAGSADLQYSNGLNRFAAAYPNRYISFGISEQNMVSAA